MSFIGKMQSSGDVQFQVIRPRIRKVPFGWTLKNRLRWGFIKGWLAVKLFAPLANWWGVATITGELAIRVLNTRTGEWTDYGVVSYRVITDAFVTFVRDDWNNGASDINLFNFHGIGTGTNAEAVGDTALQTESTTALNPDSTRATGTRSVPASNQLRSVGTLTCDADIAVTEHGFFSTSGTGTGTLADRSKFAVINLVGANPDSIQCTYTMTLTSGG